MNIILKCNIIFSLIFFSACGGSSSGEEDEVTGSFGLAIPEVSESYFAEIDLPDPLGWEPDVNNGLVTFKWSVNNASESYAHIFMKNLDLPNVPQVDILPITKCDAGSICENNNFELICQWTLEKSLICPGLAPVNLSTFVTEQFNAVNWNTLICSSSAQTECSQAAFDVFLL